MATFLLRLRSSRGWRVGCWSEDAWREQSVGERMIDLPLGTPIKATVLGREMRGYWLGGRDDGAIETIVVAGNGGEFIVDEGSIEEIV